MKIQTFPFHLQFIKPFKIAHTSRTGTDNFYILLSNGNHSGWGECVFPPYYPEKQSDFSAWIDQVQLPPNTLNINDYIYHLVKEYPQHVFGIAALDIALHNLKADQQSSSIHDLYHLSNDMSTTSFTIGMADNHEIIHSVQTNMSKVAYFKLKVSQTEIGRIISCFRTETNKPFVVDANQGFTDKALALKWCNQLAEMQVAYMEQPFHKDDLESHKWLKEKSPIPIIADESFQNIDDLAKVESAFHGINIKLMKCGGIGQAYECFKLAKRRNLKTVLGCMSESTVAANAAWELATLADWVDVDGPLLLKNDPFKDYKSVEDQITKLQKHALEQ